MNLHEKLNRLQEKFEVFFNQYIEMENENIGLRNRVAALEEENKKLNNEREIVIEKIEEILNKIP
jgi:cell division protein FtsB